MVKNKSKIRIRLDDIAEYTFFEDLKVSTLL